MQRVSGRRGQPRRRAAGPHPIDVHVGARVRLRRNMLGLSQGALGEALGLTFQQVQKYERGANRIGASRLLEIAHVLDVPVGFFYDDVDPVQAPPVEPIGKAIEGDHFQYEETVELVAAYYAILDDKIRRRLFELAKTLWEADKDVSEMGPVARRARPRPARRRSSADQSF